MGLSCERADVGCTSTVWTDKGLVMLVELLSDSATSDAASPRARAMVLLSACVQEVKCLSGISEINEE